MTLHLFNDYKKSKEKTKDKGCRSIWRSSGKNTVNKINQPYGDKNEYGEANQYQDSGHPRRFWARLLEITGEEAIDNLRLTSLLSDVVTLRNGVC